MTSVFTSRQACRQVDAADSPKFNLERQSDTADTELANTKEDTQMTIEATSVTADTETMTNDGKKIMPADAATSTKDTAMNNSKNNDTTATRFTQRLEDLPKEILALPRWIKVGTADNPKAPTTKGWQRAANQKLYNKIRGKKGFVCSVHPDDRADETRVDYMLIDADHVLDPNTGDFVNAKAKIWCNFLLDNLADGAQIFCEKSLSGTGLHILARPTNGKFNLAAKDAGTFYFGKHDTCEEKKSCPKIELFVGTEGRQVVLTGNLYRCDKNAIIPSGKHTDDIIETLINQIEIQNKPVINEKAKQNQGSRTDLLQNSAEHNQIDTQKEIAKVTGVSHGIPQELINAINQLSAEQMLAAGIISKAPSGYYICIHCGSGTHEHGTGALAVDTALGFTHWHCYSGSCDFDGNNIQLLAETWKLDTHADFVEIVHRACDTFNIPYDPKIFERHTHDAHHADNIIRTRDRIKDCPVDLRIPNNFNFGYDGITFIASRRENGKRKETVVARTPIVPTRIFCEPQKCKYTYEIAILNRGKWQTTEIDGKSLVDAKAISSLNDNGALILEPRDICRFLTNIISLNPQLKEVKAYAQTGWTDDEFKNFAYVGNDDCIIRRAGFDFNTALATRGDADAWRQKFIEVANNGGAIAHMYIGTALAAILARPLNLPNPQTHLHGTSGGGKTALQKFTASIFGNPRKLMRTFAATNKNRQIVAAAFCDLPSFYDELETIQSKAAEETLSNDVYNFSDGKGNQANKRNGDARETFEFGGSRLMTGERPILKQHDMRGAYKRLIQLDICENLFDDDFAAELHIFSEANFGHFGKLWIQFVTEHLQEIQAQFQREASWRDPSTKLYEPTQLKTVAACLVAFGFFKVMLGIDTEFDRFSFIRDRRIIIDALPTIADMDDTTRAIEFLKSFVAGNDKFFAHEVDKPEIGNEFSQQAQTCHGKKFANGEVAFLPHAFTKILEGEGGFKSADKLRNEFCTKGYLKHKDGTTTYPTWFDGKTTKMIRFLPDVISTAESVISENTADEA